MIVWFHVYSALFMYFCVAHKSRVADIVIISTSSQKWKALSTTSLNYFAPSNDSTDSIIGQLVSL